MLSFEELDSTFKYDKETGLLTWKKNRRKTSIGKEAGNDTAAGYRELTLHRDGNRYRLFTHRVAWILTHGKWPEKQIDHINGNTKDNRLVNLREVSNQENHKNMKRHKGNKSGATGVYWSKAASKWQAYICIDGKQTYLGVFEDKEEAFKIRRDAEGVAEFHKNHGRIRLTH